MSQATSLALAMQVPYQIFNEWLPHMSILIEWEVREVRID